MAAISTMSRDSVARRRGVDWLGWRACIEFM